MEQAGCPGPCNARYREAQEAYKQALALYDPLDPHQSRPEPPSIEAWPGEPVWCERDAGRIREALPEVDEAAALARFAADGYGSSSGEQRVSGSQADPSPSDDHDDRDELASTLLAHERAYRDLMGWPPPPVRKRLAHKVTGTAAWLATHLDAMLGVADGDLGKNLGLDILRWHRELCGKAKAGQRKLRKPLRCPACRLLMLHWTEGEPVVKCANPECHCQMPYAEYEAAVARAAGEAQGAGAA